MGEAERDAYAERVVDEPEAGIEVPAVIILIVEGRSVEGER